VISEKLGRWAGRLAISDEVYLLCMPLLERGSSFPDCCMCLTLGLDATLLSHHHCLEYVRVNSTAKLALKSAILGPGVVLLLSIFWIPDLLAFRAYWMERKSATRLGRGETRHCSNNPPGSAQLRSRSRGEELCPYRPCWGVNIIEFTQITVEGRADWHPRE
jgi:hypothetical protein